MRSPNASFRTRLTLRFTALMAVVFLIVGLAAVALFRRTLTTQLDGALLRLAAIEASAVSDPSRAELHFHEGTFDPPLNAGVGELTRYAEIRDTTGRVLLRSSSLGSRDLPMSPRALSAMQRNNLLVASMPWAGGALRTLYYPLAPAGAVPPGAFLQIAAPLAPVDAVLSVLVQVLVGLGLLATATTFVGGWALTTRAIRPAREIAEQAEAVSAGSLGARLHAHADAVEYHRLVAVLNAMLARLEAAFEAQRRFVGDASHEIRHPLAVLRAGLELALRRQRSDHEYRAALANAVCEVERVSTLADGLLLLARSDAGVLHPRRAPHDIGVIVASAARRAQLLADERDVRITLCGSPVDGHGSPQPGPVSADVDPELIARALDNLLGNAVKFSPGGTTVRIEIEPLDGYVAVHVIDHGPGVSPANRTRLFERFFREEPDRRTDAGAGLGLAIAQGIAAAHGGVITYTAVEPSGSRFTLRFPALQAPYQDAEAQAEPSLKNSSEFDHAGFTVGD